VTQRLEYTYVTTNREMSSVGRGFLESYVERHLLAFAEEKNLLPGKITITWEALPWPLDHHMVRAETRAEQRGSAQQEPSGDQAQSNDE